jgi:hypothetical protein
MAVAGGMLPDPEKKSGVLNNFQGLLGYRFARKYIGIGSIMPIKKKNKFA